MPLNLVGILAAGAGGHDVEVVGVVLLDLVGDTIGAVQLDVASGPEIGPPGLVGRQQLGESLARRGLKLSQGGIRDLLPRASCLLRSQ